MTKLPEWLTLAYHAREPYPRQVPLQEAYVTLDFPAGDRDRPFIYVNMVQTLDGQAVLDGKAWTIGTDVDHRLFRQLRFHADAVLYGAGTLRNDDVIVTTLPPLQERRAQRGQPPNPLAVVASSDCDFEERVFAKEFFTRRDFQKLMITTPRAGRQNLARVRAAGVPVEVVAADAHGHVAIPALMHLLAERGIHRLLAEGGPTFNVGLAHEGVIDELFLTVALRLGGDPDAPRVIAAPVTDQQLQLISELRYEEEGQIKEYYLRFRFPRP